MKPPSFLVIIRHSIALIFCLLLFSACTQRKQDQQKKQEQQDQEKILGVYGSPAPLWEKGYSLNELGINAIFVRSGAIDQKMMDRAKSEGLKVFAEFATLNGKNYVKENPEAWAINEQGKQVEAASWFMGVCPTEPGFRQYRYDQLRSLLQQFDLDGVWMDYVHWHAQFEEREPMLPETCFCDHCLKTFQESSGIELTEGSTTEKASWILSNHDKAWRDWRCEVITNWASDMKKILTEERPGALLGIYHCPWDDTEFNGARRRILGLDYDLLKKVADVFSPMVYHGRMEREPVWVRENIEWFSDRIHEEPGKGPKIWPIVQAHEVSAEDFAEVLEGGLSANASGVMMFTSNAMAKDEEKVRIMKEMYLQHK